MYCDPASDVLSSRCLVTARPRHVLNPPPPWVTAVVYRPFERKWVCVFAVWGDLKRLDASSGADGTRVSASAGGGSETIASGGTLSWSSSSVALTRGSAWNRCTKTSSQTTLVSAT